MNANAATETVEQLALLRSWCKRQIEDAKKVQDGARRGGRWLTERTHYGRIWALMDAIDAIDAQIGALEKCYSHTGWRRAVVRELVRAERGIHQS